MAIDSKGGQFCLPTLTRMSLVKFVWIIPEIQIDLIVAIPGICFKLGTLDKYLFNAFICIYVFIILKVCNSKVILLKKNI